MKNVLITGSTGMIGGIVLNQCLERSDVAKVSVINRRPLGIQNEKLQEIIHEDFLDYTPIEEAFKAQDICFFCIGVYSGQVSSEEFTKITVDYTKAFSDTLKKHSPQAVFCFLSGQGADPTEKIRILFARTKGIAENHLLGLGFKRCHIFRPGYIYPVTPRREPNFTYKLMRKLYKPVSAIYPNIGLTSVQLATKMVRVGFEGGDQTIYENKEIKK